MSPLPHNSSDGIRRPTTDGIVPRHSPKKHVSDSSRFTSKIEDDVLVTEEDTHHPKEVQEDVIEFLHDMAEKGFIEV